MTKSIYDNKLEISDKRRMLFYITYNLFIDTAAKEIGPYGGAVYNSLLRHADRNGKTWPSINLIATEWKISGRQVMRCIDKLIRLNMIAKNQSDGKNNVYQIIDMEEWKITTSDCESPVEGATSDCESPVEGATSDCESPVEGATSDCESLEPVTVSHPKKTHRSIYIKEHLSTLLFEEIVKANPHSRLLAQTPKQKEATIAHWAEDIDKLIRIDKQNPSIVEEVIKKATHDGFWGRNVLSGEALRRNWDRLTLELKIAKTNPVGSTEDSRYDKASYILNTDGWYIIDKGEQIRINEDQVPKTIRDKLEHKHTPPPPVKSLVDNLTNKLGVAYGN